MAVIWNQACLLCDFKDIDCLLGSLVCDIIESGIYQ